MEKLSGRIIKGVGGLYFVDTGVGEILSCRARGIFRHDDTSPQVGDLVEVGKSPEGDHVIFSINERKNLLIRPPLANLDRLYAAVPTTAPDPDLHTVDKLTAIAVHNGIQPAIVITKAGLNRFFAEELAEIYRKTTLPVFITDSLTGEGVDAVRSDLKENGRRKISAFAGASGVGKSTLLNALFPELALETGKVSEKTERGRHTTRKVELYPLLDGYLADTPGFTMLDFKRFDFFTKEELPDTFPEFAPYLGHCRYTKCSHTKEEGCAILDAVRSGEIAKSRHDCYLELYADLKNKHEWDKKR